jgi:DNA-binding transcriptional ArsR family regulator
VRDDRRLERDERHVASLGVANAVREDHQLGELAFIYQQDLIDRGRCGTFMMMSTSHEGAVTLLRALADPTRYAILQRLCAGPATVSELVEETGGTQAGVSNHLALLRERELVSSERIGRHVAYALSGPAIADVLEAVGAVACDDHTDTVPELVTARRCYDHLAGRLAVALFESLVEQRALRGTPGPYVSRTERTSYGEVTLGARAADVFGSLGIVLDDLRAQRRHFAIACNDWTESRPHLAGALGAAFGDALLREGWLQRRSGTRAVRITPAGRRELPRRFGARVAAVLA